MMTAAVVGDQLLGVDIQLRQDAGSAKTENGEVRRPEKFYSTLCLKNVPRHGPKKNGELVCSFPCEQLGPHLTQCRLGQGLPPYQGVSWSILMVISMVNYWGRIRPFVRLWCSACICDEPSTLVATQACRRFRWVCVIESRKQCPACENNVSTGAAHGGLWSSALLTWPRSQWPIKSLRCHESH